MPGLVAVGCLVFLVKERARTTVARVSFRDGLRQLPPRYRRFLVAVGIFGAGDFAHTLLILLATQKLTPQLGPLGAGSAAVGLYVAHNVFYAGFAFLAGWLADRVNKVRLLAVGYGLAAVMAWGSLCSRSGFGRSGPSSLRVGSMSPSRKRWRIRSAPSSCRRSSTGWPLACWRPSTAWEISSPV